MRNVSAVIYCLTGTGESELSDVSRRRFFVGLAASFGSGAGAVTLANWVRSQLMGPSFPFRDVVQDVTPRSGVQTSIRFGDTIQRLMQAGVSIPAS